jgi:hypothetical protein
LYNYERAVKAPQLSSAQQQSRQLVFNDSGGKAVKATSSFGGEKKKKEISKMSQLLKKAKFIVSTPSSRFQQKKP